MPSGPGLFLKGKITFSYPFTYFLFSVYIFMCTHVFFILCVHIPVYTCMCVHLYTCACVHACVCVFMLAYVCVPRHLPFYCRMQNHYHHPSILLVILYNQQCVDYQMSFHVSSNSFK